MGNSVGIEMKVVIVGNGYGGIAAAKALDGLCQVTLVSAGDALQNKFTQLRGAVIPGWEEASRVPLDKLLKKGKIVMGTATSVTEHEVTLADGTTLPADYIILAHGAGATAFPGGDFSDAPSSADFKARLVEKQGIVREAKNILIIGGGPVGVELSAEIKSFYPDKNVTIVHNASRLLSNSQPPLVEKATEKMASRLQDMGVELKLGVRVDHLPEVIDGDGFVSGPASYQLSDGSTINTDLTIVCVGNSKRESNLVAPVDEMNRIMVDEFLKVQGMRNVFCVGDANNVSETKMGYFAGLQAEVAAENIKRLISDKSMKPYVPANGDSKYGVMFVPLGPKKGVSAMGEKVIGDRVTSTIKGKGLFVQKVFKSANATVPVVSNTPTA